MAGLIILLPNAVGKSQLSKLANITQATLPALWLVASFNWHCSAVAAPAAEPNREIYGCEPALKFFDTLSGESIIQINDSIKAVVFSKKRRTLLLEKDADGSVNFHATDDNFAFDFRFTKIFRSTPELIYRFGARTWIQQQFLFSERKSYIVSYFNSDSSKHINSFEIKPSNLSCK